MRLFFYSPQYFLSIIITAIFSVLFGIVLKVLMIDYGVIAAFVLWGIAFTFDYLSTLSVKNYQTHETNPLFHIFSKYIPNGISFLLIGVIAFLIQFIIFLLFNDLIITYILTVVCFCTVFSNLNHRKNLLKCNSFTYNHG